MRTNSEPIKPSAQHSMHDEAFKEQAVLLMAEGTRSLNALARKLGVSAKTLRNWRRPRSARGGGGPTAGRSASRHHPTRHFKKSLGHCRPDIPPSPRDDSRHDLRPRQHPSPHRHVPDTRSITQRLLRPRTQSAAASSAAGSSHRCKARA